MTQSTGSKRASSKRAETRTSAQPTSAKRNETKRKPGSSRIASSKRAETKNAQNKKPGMFAQMKQVYKMTRESDPNIGWIMLLAALATLLVFLLIGILLHNWITFLLIGIPFAVLVAVMILSRRAEKAAFAQIDGQTGASGAAMSTLRRGWIVDQQPAAVNHRTQDVVFRAVGRPGIVLVTEGPTKRVAQLVNKEKATLRRIAPNVPVHVINAGNGEGQTPMKEVTRKMNKLENKLTQQEVQAVNSRITSLGNQNLPMPKGVDPMRMRPDRKGMRGR